MPRSRLLYTVPFIVLLALGMSQTAAADPVPRENACPVHATEATMSAILAWTPPVTATGIGRVRIDDVPSIKKDGHTLDWENPLATTILTYTYQGQTSGTWWFRTFGAFSGKLRGPEIDAEALRNLGIQQYQAYGGSRSQLNALMKYRSSSEIQWSRDLSIFEVFRDKNSKASKLITPARVAQLFKDMPEAVSSKRIVLTRYANTSSNVSRLENSTSALFAEVESMDEGSLLIHSDNGKEFFVLKRVGAQSVAYGTKDVNFVSNLIDSLPSGLAVVLSGKVAKPTLRTNRFLIWRSSTATLPIGKAVAHAKSARVFKPKAVVNGVPKNAAEHKAQGLDATAFPAYLKLAKTVNDWAAGLGKPSISSKAHFLKLLSEGHEDFVLVVAHSDGVRIFIGNKEVTLAELEAMPSRNNAPDRTIVLAVCSSGQMTATLSSLEGLGQLIIKKGFAKAVVAPANTITRPQVEAVMKAMGTNLEILLRALEGIPGNWRLIAQFMRESVIGGRADS